MPVPLQKDTFDGLNTCSLTVTQAEGKRTATSFEHTSTTTVLCARTDAHGSGRALKQQQ